MGDERAPPAATPPPKPSAYRAVPRMSGSARKRARLQRDASLPSATVSPGASSHLLQTAQAAAGAAAVTQATFALSAMQAAAVQAIQTAVATHVAKAVQAGEAAAVSAATAEHAAGLAAAASDAAQLAATAAKERAGQVAHFAWTASQAGQINRDEVQHMVKAAQLAAGQAAASASEAGQAASTAQAALHKAAAQAVQTRPEDKTTASNHWDGSECSWQSRRW